MAKAEELGEIGQFSLYTNNFQGDLLQKLIPRKHFAHDYGEPISETEEIELSLGLSLNGRFGVDPATAKMLTRSSSIPDLIKPVKDENSARVATTTLIRACSLPTETEEEWRKRKELQCLSRMEAKRKRSEKQRNLKISRDRSQSFREENCEEEKKELCVKGSEGLPPTPLAPASQGSTGSQGSGSSGISEVEKQPVQEVNKCTNAKSPASVQSIPESEQKPAISPGKTTTDKSGKLAGARKANPSNNFVTDKADKEMVRNMLENMPCVFTKGDGPSGKRVEGFLYRYRKGDEVRIVCVCHGSFLSPAEFVKHAGGGDVEQPLKHIVVNPSFL